ncbi:MAG: class I SAM-dependent methyltransferase [Candidatus Coatesbacteria bacterium]|nr:MAG: class I SAM-dependent methyltransferase [Candidatus Coatesbacteria bacterium]
MKLLDLVHREPVPEPWAEGDNIPWDDPAFSERMLAEHLCDEHDRASRRPAIIDEHVDWIHNGLLSGKPSRILDICCGPGLYVARFADAGHECVGVDYSPAAVAYAKREAENRGLRCDYTLSDIRTAEFGAGFDLAILIYGELNVFKPADALTILKKARRAVADGGLLLLEPHTYSTVKEIGERPASWYSAEDGLFSDRAHVCLTESFWDEATETTTVRYFVVDAASGEVSRYAQTFQAYSDERYRAVLEEAGFGRVEFYPAFGNAEPASDFVVIVART